MDKKANVHDVDQGFKKIGAFIIKEKANTSHHKHEKIIKQNEPKFLSMLNDCEFESTEMLTNMGKYEIIKSLQKEVKESSRDMEAKLQGFLGKMEFYSFCDKFADFTSSYEKMKKEVHHQMEELYEKISSEVNSTIVN